MSLRIFPWSGGIPYQWTPWFAWYPVRCGWLGWRWLRWVEVRMHGSVAPNGDLTDWPQFRRPADEYEAINRRISRRHLTPLGRWVVALAIIIPAALVLAGLFLVPSKYGVTYE